MIEKELRSNMIAKEFALGNDFPRIDYFYCNRSLSSLLICNYVDALHGFRGAT
jgi:hypothetical protein